ncbi:MAG: TldD/PmbA family protein [Candidatus Cloacimonetes bacterium]|nr:TldD/PmbA family protein [Candidatus Cloacimonadota bacterium]
MKRKDVKKVFDKILKLSNADETEIILFSEDEALTRYAQNYIHQNVDNHNIKLTVRTVIGKKTASATTNSLSDESLRQTLDNAIQATKLQNDNSKLLPLPSAQEYNDVKKYAEATEKYTPAERAEQVAKAVELCKKNDLEAAGIFSNSTSEVFMGNSSGLFAQNKSTQAKFSITAMKGTASGWNEVVRRNVNQIDVEKSSKIAIKKAKKSEFPVSVEPKTYPVILEPAAVAEIVLFLLFKGFNGMDYLEGTSFLADNLDKKVFSDKFSITDNPYNSNINAMPFDFEGLPVKKVELIKNGVAKNFVTNRWIAKKLEVENNAHAIPLPAQGAYPFAMCIAPGESDLNKMIENTEKAILVTHFHYSNIIDPKKLIVTGMTRDGLFLVEDGKITKPLKNMRFTDSVINLFSNIEEISQEREFASGFFGGGFLVPAMKLSGLHFSSSTDF